jgi:hypothetical protein
VKERYFRKLDVKGRIILNSAYRCGLDLYSSGECLVTNSCERGNETWDSIYGGFIDWLSDYQLLKNDSGFSYRMGGGIASLLWH